MKHIAWVPALFCIQVVIDKIVTISPVKLSVQHRAERLTKTFEKMGMTTGRFRVEWISAAEGDKYARVINEMQKIIDNIPPEKLLEEIETLRPQMEQRARRMREAPRVDEAIEFSKRMETSLRQEAAK